MKQSLSARRLPGCFVFRSAEPASKRTGLDTETRGGRFGESRDCTDSSRQVCWVVVEVWLANKVDLACILKSVKGLLLARDSRNI